MPRDTDVPPPALRIAVIGTGIAGMAAAWLLGGRHRLTIYERDDRIGGHSHTVDVESPDSAVPVDIGFIVYNAVNYPNLVALFDHLGVPSRPSDMSFSVSLDDGAREYSGTGLGGLFAQRSNLFRPRHWRMLGDVLRFYRTGASLLDEPAAEELTLGDYLDREGYSRAFVDDHLLPMAAAIWSTPGGDMRRHPAAAFVRFCTAHGLMRVRGRPEWRTVAGGSREYVRRLSAGWAGAVAAGLGVRAIRRLGGRVLVKDDRGRIEHFDRVVIAAHADQALAMLADPSDDERRILGAFRYTRNEAVLHGDPALMPKRRRVWSSWNYLGAGSGGSSAAVCVSYWMNSLQAIDRRLPLFVTLNPWRRPAAGTVHASVSYDHPAYDHRAIAAQRELARLQGVGGLWFCGSYFGAGFHEDALVSGLDAAEQAGGVRRPWTPIPAAEGISPPPMSRQAAE
jgi:predicted NAD/FAD-binding protein